MAMSNWTPWRSNRIGELSLPTLNDGSVVSLASTASLPPRNKVNDETGWINRLRCGSGNETANCSPFWRTLIIIMVPIMVLFTVTARSFGQSLNVFITASDSRNSLRLSTELGSFIHSLQCERDNSALYLSSIVDSKSTLLKTYKVTDAFLLKLSMWPVKDENIHDEYESRERFLGYLAKHRYMLDTLNNSIDAELEFYTSTINRFIKWIYSAITRSRSGLVWKSLLAYQDTIIAKEHVGIVRAIGSIYYNRGGYTSIAYYNGLLESQDVANTSLESARRYSNIVFEVYDMSFTKNLTLKHDIFDFRYELRYEYTHNDGKGVEETAIRFFETMSAYLDILLVIQTQLLTTILRIIDLRGVHDVQKMTVIGCAFGCVLMVCPVIVMTTYRLAREKTTYVLILNGRIQNVDDETAWIDKLLFQLLPKSIAQQLKVVKMINPDNFNHVTICFSDIIGFREMSSHSSPQNVVSVLNNLYATFDELIKKYDVCKVTTIGDTYMVASGLPNRNGNRHAAEIAIMALEMIQCTKEMKMAHMRDNRIRIRIGCHTGRVAAGVVGEQVPKYCLFGETVTTASKMEALSISGRIHITQTTRDILESMGGYEITRRDDNAFTASCSLMKAFKGSFRTYWLHGHKSMKQTGLQEQQYGSDTTIQSESEIASQSMRMISITCLFTVWDSILSRNSLRHSRVLANSNKPRYRN